MGSGARLFDFSEMVESDNLSSSFSPSPPTPQPAEKKQPPKQWGITKPLSLAGPSDMDIQRTKELEKVSCRGDGFSLYCKHRLLIAVKSHELLGFSF